MRHTSRDRNNRIRRQKIGNRLRRQAKQQKKAANKKSRPQTASQG